MDPDQEEARLIIQKALRLTGLTPTALAREGGVASTTLTRFLNNPGVKHAPTLRTLKKIARASGLRFTVESPDEQTTADEELLILCFRRLSDDRKRLLITTCEAWIAQLTNAPGGDQKRGGDNPVSTKKPAKARRRLAVAAAALAGISAAAVS